MDSPDSVGVATPTSCKRLDLDGRLSKQTNNENVLYSGNAPWLSGNSDIHDVDSLLLVGTPRTENPQSHVETKRPLSRVVSFEDTELGTTGSSFKKSREAVARTIVPSTVSLEYLCRSEPCSLWTNREIHGAMYNDDQLNNNETTMRFKRVDDIARWTTMAALNGRGLSARGPLLPATGLLVSPSPLFHLLDRRDLSKLSGVAYQVLIHYEQHQGLVPMYEHLKVQWDQLAVQLDMSTCINASQCPRMPSLTSDDPSPSLSRRHCHPPPSHRSLSAGSWKMSPIAFKKSNALIVRRKSKAIGKGDPSPRSSNPHPTKVTMSQPQRLSSQRSYEEPPCASDECRSVNTTNTVTPKSKATMLLELIHSMKRWRQFQTERMEELHTMVTDDTNAVHKKGHGPPAMISASTPGMVGARHMTLANASLNKLKEGTISAVLRKDRKYVARLLSEYGVLAAKEFPLSYGNQQDPGPTQGRGYINFAQWYYHLLSPLFFDPIDSYSTPVKVNQHLANIKGWNQESFRHSLLRHLHLSTKRKNARCASLRVVNGLDQVDMGQHDSSQRADSHHACGILAKLFPGHLIPHTACGSYHADIVELITCLSSNKGGLSSNDILVHDVNRHALISHTIKNGLFSMVNTAQNVLQSNNTITRSRGDMWPSMIGTEVPHRFTEPIASGFSSEVTEGTLTSDSMPYSLSELAKPRRNLIGNKKSSQSSKADVGTDSFDPTKLLYRDVLNHIARKTIEQQCHVLEIILAIPLSHTEWSGFRNELFCVLRDEFFMDEDTSPLSVSPDISSSRDSMALPKSGTAFDSRDQRQPLDKDPAPQNAISTMMLNVLAPVYSQYFLEQCDVNARENSQGLFTVADLHQLVLSHFKRRQLMLQSKVIRSINLLRYYIHARLDSEPGLVIDRNRCDVIWQMDPTYNKLMENMHLHVLAAETFKQQDFANSYISQAIQERHQTLKMINYESLKLRISNGTKRSKGGGYLRSGMMLSPLSSEDNTDHTNRYLTLHCLGRGGFAEVWEVLSLNNDLRRYAAKITFLDSSLSDSDRDMVLNITCSEVRLQNQLRNYDDYFVNMVECFEIAPHIFCSIMTLGHSNDIQHVLSLNLLLPTEDPLAANATVPDLSKGVSHAANLARDAITDDAYGKLLPFHRLSHIASMARQLPDDFNGQVDYLNNHKVVAYWAHCLINALAKLEELSIVHRDIKPANLLLFTDEEHRTADHQSLKSVRRDYPALKIADFGLGRFISKNAAKDQSHVVVNYEDPVERALGTIPYQSPEASLGRLQRSTYLCDHSEDMWQAGAVIYQLVFERDALPFGSQRVWGGMVPNSMKKSHSLASSDESTDFTAATIVSDASSFHYWSNKYDFQNLQLPWRVAKFAIHGYSVLEEELFRDLIGGMLAPKQKRISARDALQHPFFANFRFR